MLEKAATKRTTQLMPKFDEYDVEQEIDCEASGSHNKNVLKKPKPKGPLDRFVTTPPPDILLGRKQEKGIFGACVKDAREKTVRAIARWIYDAGIPFNCVTYESFDQMLEEIAQYGLGLQPPTMYALRVPLLKKEVDDTHAQLVEHKKEWASKGCSIMSYGWRDSVV
ncbi:unnamed protein product [Arabis nemorensis]|uniref:DUF659 domain-containing protein n=1 Tax=Arabis nemorensis TaxID=586526 RepID=A0A565BJG5_9BRAS|nr:unnamed protein product [Arabis nemorensis]